MLHVRKQRRGKNALVLSNDKLFSIIGWSYMLITTYFFSEDPLVQWLARGAVTTGRLRLTNSKVTGSNPVWVELFCFIDFRAYSFCEGVRMDMICSHWRYRWVGNERAWQVYQRSTSPDDVSFFCTGTVFYVLHANAIGTVTSTSFRCCHWWSASTRTTYKPSTYAL